MRSLFIVLIFLSMSFSVCAADPYDNQYCRDPAQNQQWGSLLEEHPADDTVAALHTLWIGLCVQAELRQMKTNRAQIIFENFKQALIESISRELEKQSNTDKIQS